MQLPVHVVWQEPEQLPWQNPLSQVLAQTPVHDEPPHSPEQLVLQLLLQPPVQLEPQLPAQAVHPGFFELPLHDKLQLPEHPLLQLEQVDDFDEPSQPPEQEELQKLLHDEEHEEPVQPLLFSKLSKASKSSSSSQDTIVGSIVTPTKIGSVFLIACLKKSLRLIMSFFISIL